MNRCHKSEEEEKKLSREYDFPSEEFSYAVPSKTPWQRLPRSALEQCDQICTLICFCHPAVL